MAIERYRRLVIIIRPIIVTVVLAPEIYFRKNEPFSLVLPIFLVVLTAYFASVIFYLILKTGKRGTVFDFSQTIIDTIIIASIVNFTGGINSPYVLLYFLNIFEGSLFLCPSASFTITTIISVSLIAMCVVWMNHNLSPKLNSHIFNIEIIQYFWKTFIYILSFYLITTFISYFKERFQAGSRALEEVRMTTDDILENINSGIITIDGSGRIKHFNPAAKSILTIDRNKIIDSLYEDVFPPRLKKFSDYIANYSPKDNVPKKLEIIDKNGKKLPVMVHISTMKRKDVDYPGLLINIIDLTEEERIQQRLRNTDRMKTALELSAGIAHEIRNPLTSIQGAVEVITREIQTNEKVKKLVTLVLKETERLNIIIERFLQFVRIPRRERKNVDVSIILRDVVELVKNHPKYNKGIEINVKFPDEKHIVFVDPEQLKQVFLNILLNAFSAIGKKGVVGIKLLRRDKNCGIAFSDNGIGIKTENIQRIFQPFFSMNPTGSGLGLSVAHRIVEQHKGEITVNSKKGEGSTFTVWLPLVTLNEKQMEPQDYTER